MSYTYAFSVKPNGEFYQHVLISRINLIEEFLYSINKNIVIPNVKNLYFYKDETFTKNKFMIYDNKKYPNWYNEIYYFNLSNYLYSKKSITEILSRINKKIYINLEYMDMGSARFDYLLSYNSQNVKLTEKEIEKQKENKRRKYLHEMYNFIKYDVIALNNHFNSNNSRLFTNNLKQLYKFEDAIHDYEYIKSPYSEFPSNKYTSEEKSTIFRIFNMFIYAFEKKLDITIPCICDKLNIKFDMNHPFHFKPLHLLVLNPDQSPVFYPKQINETTYIHAIQGDDDFL
jgi:hypothetical protein